MIYKEYEKAVLNELKMALSKKIKYIFIK